MEHSQARTSVSCGVRTGGITCIWIQNETQETRENGITTSIHSRGLFLGWGVVVVFLDGLGVFELVVGWWVLVYQRGVGIGGRAGQEMGTKRHPSDNDPPPPLRGCYSRRIPQSIIMPCDFHSQVIYVVTVSWFREVGFNSLWVLFFSTRRMRWEQSQGQTHNNTQAHTMGDHRLRIDSRGMQRP